MWGEEHEDIAFWKYIFSFGEIHNLYSYFKQWGSMWFYTALQ